MKGWAFGAAPIAVRIQMSLLPGTSSVKANTATPGYIHSLFTSERNLVRLWAFGVCLSVFGKEVAGWVMVVTRIFVVF